MAVIFKGILDDLCFIGVHQMAEPFFPAGSGQAGGRRFFGSGLCPKQVLRQVVGFDKGFVLSREVDGLGDDMPQFPDIAGPAVVFKNLFYRAGQPGDLFPSTGAILPIKYSAVSEISSRRRISGGSSMEKTARR